ncbi:putative ribonuclease H-like domain-containing protein [Tanacetum coccineum]
MDLKWPVAMISMRLKKFYKKTGRKLHFNAKEPVGFNKSKVECFNYHKTGHFARECRLKGNQESRRRDAGNNRYKAKDNRRRPRNRRNLKLCQMSAKDKSELGYGDQIHEGVLSYEKEAFESVFDSRSSDVEDSPVYDRFAKVKGMHAVPPLMTGIYMPPRSDFGIDKSNFTYGSKQSKTSKSNAKTSNFDSCESNSSKETLESVPKPAINEPKVVSEPKVWSDAPIIEEYESNNNDENVTKPSKEQEKPSYAFVNTVKHVKTTRETVKEQNTCSPSIKADKRDWNGLMSKKLGLGYGFTKKACFKGKVNTARQNFSSQAAATSTARKVNTARPMVNDIRPRNNFYKSHSSIRRPFNRTTAPKANFTNNKVNTVGDKTVSAVGGNRETTVKALDDPLKALKNKGIVDSRCSRHMTGNKAYLVEYQEYNGGPIAFKGSKGQITGKGKIITGKLDFEDMYFVKELKEFNLFSMSQMCDKKNKVLFTDSECLVLSPDFKLPDENQVLLRVPRQNNMYSFNLENIVPSGGLACLIAKATVDESNKWHRRLGHPVTSKNKANKTAGPKKANHSIGTQDNIDTCNSKKEAEPAQEYYSNEKPVNQEEQAFLEELERLKGQEKEDDDAAKALRKEFTQDTEDLLLQVGAARATTTNTFNTLSTPVSTASPSRVFSAGESSYPDSTNYADQNDSQIPALEDIYDNSSNGIFTNASYDNEGAVADFINLETTMNVSPIPTSRIHSIHPITQILGDPTSAVQTRSKHCLFACFLSKIKPKKISEALEDKSWVDAMQEELLQFKIQKVYILVDLPYGKRAIGTKWVYKNKKDERGVVVRNKARLVARGYRQEEGIDYDDVFTLMARIEAIRIFLAFASYMGFIVYQMDVKSAFLYGTINGEVYVSQPLGFVDPKFPKKVYKVIKALYGLHQAPRAWYVTLFTFLVKSRYRRGTIDKTLFIKKDKKDIMLVKQKEDGIFISQDKYVAEILKKFDFASVKTAGTLIKTQKPLTKDEEAANVDVHLYRSMIGSLMYLTASRPDIIFAVCACSRFQVTPKTSHLYAVKRIFRRLISLQCKKQTIVATSTIEAEYAAAANCCGQHNMVAYLEKTEGSAPFHEFWNSAVSQIVNNVSQIKTIVSGKAVSIFEASIRRYLLFNDVDGIGCLTNSKIYENLQLMEMIFDGMIRNLDAKKKFLMYPRFVQVFLNNQLSNLPAPLDNFPIPVLTKKVFTNMVKKGLHFSGYVIPLFHNMLTQAVVDGGVGSEQPTKPQPTPSPTQPSIRDQHPVTESSLRPEHIDRPSINLEGTSGSKGYQAQTLHDSPLLGGQTSDRPEGGLNLEESFVLCTNLSNRVLALETVKDAQAAKIIALKTRIKKLEKKSKEKCKPEPTLDDSTFDDLDADHDMDHMDTEEPVNEGRLSKETKELNETHDTEFLEKGGSNEEPVSTAVSTATPMTPPTTTSVFEDEDIFLADALVMLSDKTKLKGMAIKEVKEPDRPARSILTLKPLLTIDPKDKGKGVLKESPVNKVKRSDLDVAQIAKDAKVARLVYEEELAKLEREKEERQRQEQASIDYIANLHDEVKAKIDTDQEVAVRWTHDEQEKYIVDERAKLLAEFFKRRKKQLAKERAAAIRNKPPTRTQLRGLMMTYLKHTGRFKHIQLNIKTFEEIQGLYIKEQERAIDFVPIGSEEDERQIQKMNKKAASVHEEKVLEEYDGTKINKKDKDTSKKRKEGPRMKRMSKKKKTNSDLEEEEHLKTFLKIVPDAEGEVDYKVLEKRSDGSSRWIKTFSEMVTRFDRLDLLELYNLVIQRVHTLILEDGTEIHMLAKRKYPLTKETLERMMSLKLVTETASKSAYNLLRFIQNKELASPKQMALGKDISNPLIVDSLLKTIWLSMHHARKIYSDWDHQELLQTMREFHTCRQEEGQLVRCYVLKMKSYIDQLECLGHPVTSNLEVSLILVGLSKKYDNFVKNYNMHSMDKTVNELHAMLKLHEETLPKKVAAHALHTIRAGKVQKNKNRKPSKVAKGVQGKGKGKKEYANAKPSYAPKPKIPPPPKKDDPAKDAICHHCDEVYDTGYGTHICNTTQGLRGSKKLNPKALSLDGLYEIEMSCSNTNDSSMYNVSNKRTKLNLDSSLLWHYRVGHISKKHIKKLQHDRLLNSTEIESLGKYVSCMSGKMVRKPYSHQVERAKDLLGLIHIDSTLDRDGVDWTGHAEDENLMLGDASIEIQAYTQALKKVEAQLMRAKDKSGLGYGDQTHEGVLSYENEVLESVFDNRSSDVEDTPVYDRFSKVKGMHGVPPLMTGIYMPPKFDFGIDNVETLESVPKPTVNEPKAVSKPKVWSDAPIIKEYELDSDDEYVIKPSKEQEKPSFAFVNTVKHVKTLRETVKEQNTCSPSPKADKKDWNGLMSKKLGLGYRFTRKACFVCDIFGYLIRDCDFHEKRMAKQVELNKQNGKGTGQGENRPIFLVNAARQNLSRQAAATNTTRKVNTARPIDDPQKALKNKGIVDSGCSKHMTGNKAYLVKYQDYNGGPVAFGGSKGQITGKGKIITGKLDFEDVYFVKEQKQFNLFFVSQMCDKKNKVLFTDSECLVLFPNFKLPDENQVLLRVSRQNNMYSFNLENIVPTGGLACLIAKATVDESNKWHRRLGHGRLIEFCRSKGIKREYSNARTPQQNGVAERKNRTLIEAARTMLADSFLPNTFWAEAVSTACYVLNRVLVTKPQNKTPYELITGKIPIISYIRPFGCHVTILNTIDHLGKFEEKSDEGFLVGYSLNSKAFRVYNLETKRVEENLHINFLENKPNVAGKGPNWLFDLDYLTDSMNYQPVTVENKANKTAGPKEANHSAGTQDNIDAGNSEMEAEPAQEYFTNEGPVDQAFLEELERLKRQEKEANDAAEAFRKEFAQCTEEFLLQAGAAKATSTNIVNTVSTPVSTASPLRVFSAGGPSYPDLTNNDQDDSQIPALMDIHDNLSNGIFTNASYDNEVQTRSKVNKSSGAHTFVNYIQKQRRNNHKDFQYCLFACFLSQIEPKKISQALEDESWVDAMQEELLQFKIQKVWILNKARLGYRQEEGINYDEVFAPVARIEAIRIFLAFASYMRFIFPKKVYKVVKALYGLHQAPKAWYATLSTFLLKSEYRRGTIDKTLFIKKYKNDIITPIETLKPLIKDEEAADVDVHLYRSIIGSLMYLTAFRPDIMFAETYLMAVQEANNCGYFYYRGRVCCCCQLLWASIVDSESNIYIDNESTICIVKDPVFHSKIKHIKIRHHFIRDAYEKKLIQVLKIHTDDNVADLLTKAFDVSRFNFLIVNIGMLNL